MPAPDCEEKKMSRNIGQVGFHLLTKHISYNDVALGNGQNSSFIQQFGVELFQFMEPDVVL